jgi:hypothetical protein
MPWLSHYKYHNKATQVMKSFVDGRLEVKSAQRFEAHSGVLAAALPCEVKLLSL